MKIEGEEVRNPSAMFARGLGVRALTRLLQAEAGRGILLRKHTRRSPASPRVLLGEDAFMPAGSSIPAESLRADVEETRLFLRRGSKAGSVCAVSAFP